MDSITVIDLFAGPGGLGEGFSAFKSNNVKPFKINISIEKEKFAHQTLLLRSFCRQFNVIPKEYYQYISGDIEKDNLFSLFPDEFLKAKEEAWLAELGEISYPHKEVISRIKKQVKNLKNCVVIGGPPCQAYSIIGRSKMSGNDDFNEDPRHTLYKEYLKIIADTRPAVFVMENVKGILSSKLNGDFIFDRILSDIQRPSSISDPTKKRFKKNETYSVYSLVSRDEPKDLKRTDFTIKCEDYGIPQRRHRVILLAVRNDIKKRPKQLTKAKKKISVKYVIEDLPRLRSGLSKIEDNSINWTSEIQKKFPTAILIENGIRGSNYIKGKTKPGVYKNWFNDSKLKGVLNHETRSHISGDLHRYFFISEYAKDYKKSPTLKDLPKKLLPNHNNVKAAIKSGSLFSDRFKVQVADKPATTITAHISKDGHYFIHYDSEQCRSFTVREAARIQTFPDNYKFEGPRTAQYQQVGNAVPPLLAHQIADIVYELLSDL